MAILRVEGDQIRPVAETTFSAEGLLERGDLQRLLKKNISVLGDDLMVIAEEFGEWEESRRRIDLLALDRNANLVVIELKRDDSAHMELQAIRYAAMVSAMTFDHLVAVHERYLEQEGSEEDARESILSFLEAEGESGDPPLGDARVILSASEFSLELTTSVLWLNEKGLDIRCVRMKPYRQGEHLLIDAQQIIPLVESQEYVIRLREKRREERERSHGSTMETFWKELRPEYQARGRELISWLESRFTRIWPGRGACTPLLVVGRTKHRLFRFRSDGRLALFFDYMSRKAPFSDLELRLELLRRLNEIEGVNISSEKLEKRPRIRLEQLDKPESMERFKTTVEWWLGRVAEHHKGSL